MIIITGRHPQLDVGIEETNSRRKASKPAEMVAVLIAMAQQQALRLTGDRHENSRCCENAVCVSYPLQEHWIAASNLGHLAAVDLGDQVTNSLC